MVHKEKDKKTAVDEREEARYSSKMRIEKVEKQYDEIIGLCREAISQAEDIVFSKEKFEVPKELLE